MLVNRIKVNSRCLVRALTCENAREVVNYVFTEKERFLYLAGSDGRFQRRYLSDNKGSASFNQVTVFFFNPFSPTSH